jgi:hypothetical protein
MRVWISGLIADRFGHALKWHFYVFCFTLFEIMALDWDDDIVSSGMENARRRKLGENILPSLEASFSGGR